MKEIYERAEKMGITIYPYQRARLDKTPENHIITNINELSDGDFSDYLEALYNVWNENAGGWDGWSTAHKVFERLGFVKKEVRQGHRVFVSMVYEPKHLDKIMNRKEWQTPLNNLTKTYL